MGKLEDQRRGVWKMLAQADGVDMVLMAVGFVGSIADGLTFPAVIMVKGRLINSVGRTLSSGSIDHHMLLRNVDLNAMLLVYIALAAWFFCFLEGYCWTRTAERQASQIRSRYMKAVLRQDVTYFDTSLLNVSDVVTSVSNDALIIQECISEKVPNFLMNISTFIGCYVVSFIFLWKLAVVAVPFLVPLVVPGIVYGRVLVSLARKMRGEYGKAGSIVEQAISSIRTVYAFVGESNTVSAFSEALQGSLKLGLKQGLAKGFAMGNNGLTFAIWSFTTWYSSRLVMYHGAKGGTAFATGVCLNVGGKYLGSSLSNLKYFSEAYAAAERIAKMIYRVPIIDSYDMGGNTLENIRGEVEFKDVKFAYPSRPETLILDGLSLKVPAGKTIALVGKSGSGKSTVVSLLQRFYNPLGGKILVDGVPIEELQLKWLRSQMGLVSQEPTLFATSIKENILFGREGATMDDVIEAAIASNAHQFIDQLPYRYDTQVGERGVQLSGGQKQRIAIARAIIRKPRILLLDEATSALDSESEVVVQEALDNVSKGTTNIIIAHRLSTIRHAHMISVIQQGQVVETGSHDELIRLPNGLYFTLQQQQSQACVPGDIRSRQKQENHEQESPPMVKDRTTLAAIDGSSCDKLSPKNKKPVKPSLRRLVGLSFPEWKMGMLGCLTSILFGATQPLYALIMGAMISVYFLPTHEEIKKQTRIYSSSFAALAVLAFAMNVVQHYSFAYVGENLALRVRQKMLAKILTFEVGWFDRDENSTGATCSRLANDANAVKCLIGDRTCALIQASSFVLIAIIMGLMISRRLAIVMIIMQPLIIFCLYTRRVLLRKMSNKSVKQQQKSSNIACEAVSNIRIITSFSLQSRILEMLEEAQVIPRQENIRQSWYTGVALATSQIITILFSALSFWYGGKLIVDGYMRPRQMFQTVMILERTGRFIADVGSMVNDLARGTDAVHSVFNVLDQVSLIEPEEGHKPHQFMGLVEIRDVDFAYPSRPDVMVFRGFSVDIQPGKSTAFVGQSGSGKSTIVGLIERFYDPLGGAVRIDGRDIRTYHLRSLRKHMALVSQEPTLFAGSIRENIVYGASDGVDESEVVEAAKAANAHDFISGLSHGYDTWCGDKGVQLSGGQKQRIAIARAIMKNPRILLLDEATSALDNQSERVVQQALEQMMVGRTSVVIAHRLSTIQNCDMIVVLEKGMIVESGNHASLLAMGSSGAYYSLIALQTSSHAT